MAQEVKIELALDTSKFDRQLSGAVKTAGKLENELDNISEVKVDIAVDTSQIDKASAEIKSIDGTMPNVDVDVSVDDSKVESLFNKLKTPVLITLGVVAGGAGAAAGLMVNEIQSDTAAIRAFTTATDTAAAPVEEIGGIIGDVWNTGLAESKTQIAGIAAELYRAGVPIGELGKAAQDALTIAAQTGEDTSSIIQAQVKLVNTGLATSYQEASDIISGGFAQGLNRSGDFLDTIKEYSKDFSDLGVSGETFFNILNSGLEGGAYNTDKIADSFRELKIRVATALSTGEGTEFDALKNLGLLDEARAREAGTITGEQFVEAALAAFETGGLGDLVGVFGSPTEDLGTAVFNSINDALGNPELLSTWAGTTDRMVAGLEDSLGFALGRAKNVIVDNLASGFQLAGQPLIDLLDGLPDKLNAFSDLVASGAGIPEALEIALSAPGLSEDLRAFQGAIGGFIIEFQLGLAGLLDAVGQGGAAGGLRTSAGDMAQGQLAFDLQFLDVEDATTSIATALRRGVDEAGINEAIAEAGANLIDENQMKQFSTLLDQIGNTAFLPTTISTGGGRVSETRLLESTIDDLDVAKASISDIVASTSSWLSPTVASFGDVIRFDTDQLLEDAGVIEKLGIRTAGADDALIEYGQTVDATSGRFDVFGDRVTKNADLGAAAVEGFGSRVTATLSMVNEAAMITQQHLFDAGIDPAAFAALTFGASVNAAAVDGSHASGLDYVPYDNYLGNLHKGEMVLNAGDAAAYRGGGGGNTNISTVNINVTQNLSSSGMAQSTAAGSRFANSIRGY